MDLRQLTSAIASGLALSLLLAGCAPTPAPINYGSDACHFCKMNIVDAQHGAERVTKKGKLFKYDAIECMLHDLKKQDPTEQALYLVNAYDAPAELIDAQSCLYLISEAIPSPMGAYLSAFRNHATAKQTLDAKGGKLYQWSEIQEELASR